MEKDYIFKSKRLGFRNWITSDLAKMVEINANKKVMEFFPFPFKKYNLLS